MIEIGFQTEHEVYENGRFVTLQYHFDGYSSANKGLWSYRVAGEYDWWHVNNPLVRERLTAGKHSREGDRCTVFYVVERLTNEQFDALAKAGF